MSGRYCTYRPLLMRFYTILSYSYMPCLKLNMMSRFHPDIKEFHFMIWISTLFNIQCTEQNRDCFAQAIARNDNTYSHRAPRTTSFSFLPLSHSHSLPLQIPHDPLPHFRVITSELWTLNCELHSQSAERAPRVHHDSNIPATSPHPLP